MTTKLILKQTGFALILGIALNCCKENQKTPQVFTGFITLGNEVSDFEACNHPGFKYWVEDETGSFDSLYQLVASAEYEPVFVQMEALKLPRLEMGYAEERDGLLKVQKVIKMEKRTEDNNCLP